MRVHVFSDLHLEFSPIQFSRQVTSGELAELVLLAGDIDTKRRAVRWASETFSQAVVLVGGNHEPYGDSLYAAIAESRKVAGESTRTRNAPIHFLEREICELRTCNGVPVRIIGATLWTDFSLFGEQRALADMERAWRDMNDYVRIKVRDRFSGEKIRLTPQDTADFHLASRRFIETELAKKVDGYTIVLTHHAPSSRSLPPYRQEDPHAAAYASSLEHLIEAFQPALWAHGHVHSSADYTIGKTRVVCNPRGYVPDYPNRTFNPELAIELK